MAIGIFWSLICLCVFISVLVYDKRMGGFVSKNKFPVDGRVGFCTSSAIDHWLTAVKDNHHLRRLAGHGTQRRSTASLEGSQRLARCEGCRKTQGRRGLRFCKAQRFTCRALILEPDPFYRQLQDTHRRNFTTSVPISKILLKGRELSQKPQHGMTASHLT